jgi:hypothetical protein
MFCRESQPSEVSIEDSGDKLPERGSTEAILAASDPER